MVATENIFKASTLGGTAVASAIGSFIAYRGAKANKVLTEEHQSKLRLLTMHIICGISSQHIFLNISVPAIVNHFELGETTPRFWQKYPKTSVENKYFWIFLNPFLIMFVSGPILQMQSPSLEMLEVYGNVWKQKRKKTKEKRIL